MDGALARGIRPVAMLFDADQLADDDPRLAATEGLAERYLVPPKLMAQASGLAAAPRVIAILPQPPVRSFRDVRFPPSLGLYLAGVADPGNVGTLRADGRGARRRLARAGPRLGRRLPPAGRARRDGLDLRRAGARGRGGRRPRHA